MSAQVTDFRRGAVNPIECLSAGWQLVKDQYWPMVGICAVGLLIGSIAPFGILLGPLMCGIHMCMFALMRREQPSFNLLFKGFDFFVPSLIATLVQIVPVMVLLVPAYVVFIVVMLGAGAAAGSGGGPPEAFSAIFVLGFVLFFLFVMAVGIAVGTFFMFSYQLVADRGLSGLDACKVSAKAVLANLGGAAGLTILTALLGLVGVLFCYVGAFLVMPVGLAAMDVAYRQVFPPLQAAPPDQYAPPPQYPNYGEHYSPPR